MWPREGIDARRRRRAWALWALTTLVMTAHTGAAFVACQAPRAEIELSPSRTIELDVFRYTTDTVLLDLAVTRLPPSAEPIEWLSNRPIEFHVAPMAPGAAPSTYTARERSWSNRDSFGRRVAPTPDGTWNPVALKPGFNRIRIDVGAVDPALLGATATVTIQPAMSFKWSAGGIYEFLWPALLLWPVFLISQTIWSLVLLWRAVRPVRPKQGENAYFPPHAGKR